MKPVSLLFIAATSVHGAIWIPLQPTNDATFFNADIVYENDGSPAATSQIGSRYFFEAGLNPAVSGSANGLRTDRTYTYATTGATFVLQNYSGNNSSRTSSAGSTMTATFAPGNYSTIAVAAAVGNMSAGANLTWTVTYTTGGTTSGFFKVDDWGGNSLPNELFNVARTDVIDGANPEVRPNDTKWSAFVYEIATDPTRTIQSVTYVTSVTGDPTGDPPAPSTITGDVHILGFSGFLVPEPSSSALFALTLGSSLLIRRRK